MPPMRIVVAPDSFKESLSAPAAAEAIRDGLHTQLPDAAYELVPLADGGEGTVDALLASGGGEARISTVTGPAGAPVAARWALLDGGRTAVIEVAQASGLALLAPGRRDAAATTSYGSGELVRHALDAGPRRLVVGLGGVATNDGGAGLLQALGVRFLDAGGAPLDGPIRGADLEAIAGLDTAGLDPRLRHTEVLAASDVDNPLTGPQGASATFGPQKGADPATVERLDRALARCYALVAGTLGRDVAALPGAGAAGGLGAALLAFLDARLRPGVELVMEAAGLEARLRGAALAVTGEGRLDAQTLRGKTPLGVAALAGRLGVPAVAIAGSLADAEALLADGRLRGVEAAVCRPMTQAQALAEAAPLLRDAAARVGAWIRLAGALPAAPAGG